MHKWGGAHLGEVAGVTVLRVIVRLFELVPEYSAAWVGQKRLEGDDEAGATGGRRGGEVDAEPGLVSTCPVLRSPSHRALKVPGLARPSSRQRLEPHGPPAHAPMRATRADPLPVRASALLRVARIAVLADSLM